MSKIIVLVSLPPLRLSALTLRRFHLTSFLELSYSYIISISCIISRSSIRDPLYSYYQTANYANLSQFSALSKIYRYQDNRSEIRLLTNWAKPRYGQVNNGNISRKLLFIVSA